MFKSRTGRCKFGSRNRRLQGIESLERRDLLAVTPVLLQDLNPGTESSSPQLFAQGQDGVRTAP